MWFVHSGTAAAATELPSIKMEMLSQGNRSFYIDGNDNTIQGNFVFVFSF